MSYNFQRLCRLRQSNDKKRQVIGILFAEMCLCVCVHACVSILLCSIELLRLGVTSIFAVEERVFALTFFAHHLNVRMVGLLARLAVLQDVCAGTNVFQPIVTLVVVVLEFGQADRAKSCCMSVSADTVKGGTRWRSCPIAHMSLCVSAIDRRAEHISRVTP